MQLENCTSSSVTLTPIGDREETSCCANLASRIHVLFQTIDSFYYDHTSRLVRNMVRVGLAGGLSTFGGVLSSDTRVSGFFHLSQRLAIWIGSGIGGVGNGVSTWLAWETDSEDRLAVCERLLSELREAREQEYRIHDRKVRELNEQMEELKRLFQEQVTKPKSE